MNFAEKRRQAEIRILQDEINYCMNRARGLVNDYYENHHEILADAILYNPDNYTREERDAVIELSNMPLELADNYVRDARELNHKIVSLSHLTN